MGCRIGFKKIGNIAVLDGRWRGNDINRKAISVEQLRL
jgi:hypothetical protein